MRWLLIGAVIVGAALVFGRKSPEGVRVPVDPNEVLERVASSSASGRELKALEVEARAHPDDTRRAAAAAGKAIELARREADPRYWGRAQAALQLWWDDPHPPAEVLALRAVIRREQRDFDGARADLELLPGPSTKLDLAAVERATGRYEQARAACRELEGKTDPVVAVACTAQVDSLTSHAREAKAALEQQLAKTTDAEARTWALSVLGAVSERAGDDAAAERAYREALKLAADRETLTALADLLLATGRPQEVEPLLKEWFSDDNALLRLAIAEVKQQGKPGPYAQMLRWRYAAAADRGDTTHLREHARFQLEVERDATRALELATRNWAAQREPADARVLLESALAAKQPEAARAAAQSLVDAKAEEPRLIALAKQVLAARESPR